MSKNQVILLMTDTQRKDMITCYNREYDMNTPNLDNLAKNGMRFERAYTAQPVCGPARAALFTGTYPHTNGSVANSMFLSEGTKTLGQRLTKEGIHTAYIGKWHLDGGDYFGNGLCPDGYDPNYWFDMRNYLDLMKENDRLKSRLEETSLSEEVLPSFTYAHQCSDRAIEFIEKHKDQDFMLVVSYDEPHHPFLAPSQYFELFKDRKHNDYGNVNINLENHPEHIKIWAQSQGNPEEVSYKLRACNAFVDKEIGRVLNTIEENIQEPVIIYTSDHGAGLGAHGIIDKGAAMYDEITNIPLIVKWPSNIDKNQINNNPVSLVDVVPTILDIFNIDQPKTLEGRSMVLTLKDKNVKTNDYVFMEFTRYEIDHDGFGGFQPIRGITDGRYKLSINLMTTDELYDTKNDKGEIHNLIENEDYFAIRNQLHDELLKWMDQTRDPFRGYYWQQRTWRTDAKEATWACTGMTRQRNVEKGEIHQLDYDTGLPITEYIRKK